jgi:hypothetical protein
LLLDAGADVNALDEEDCAALHVAAMNDRLDVIKLLLNAGPEMNISDNEGKTPLDIVQSRILFWNEIRKGKDFKGAEIAAEIRTLLRSHGAKTGAEISQEKSEGFFRRLINFFTPGARTV